MILVDSSVWIDYFNGIPRGQTDLLDDYLSNVPVIMGDLILTEVLQGFKSNKDYETAKAFLSALPFRQMGGYHVAIQSAQNYRRLRKAGITVRKTIDIIIDRLSRFGALDRLEEVYPPKDWSKKQGSGPRKIVREDQQR